MFSGHFITEISCCNGDESAVEEKNAIAYYYYPTSGRYRNLLELADLLIYQNAA